MAWLFGEMPASQLKSHRFSIAFPHERPVRPVASVVAQQILPLFCSAKPFTSYTRNGGAVLQRFLKMFKCRLQPKNDALIIVGFYGIENLNSENSTLKGFLEPFSAIIPTSMLLGNFEAMDSLSIHWTPSALTSA